MLLLYFTYYCSIYCERFLRRIEKDTALFILGILQIPAIAIFILASLKLSLSQLGAGEILNWIDRGFTAFLIAAFTYGITLLFTEAGVYYLKDYARK